MNFKQQIHQYYQQLVQDRIDVFRDMIAALTQDAKNDAKGSAGDKHETALSMMHLEQEKLNRKLVEILEQKSILDKIDPMAIHNKIALGSVVETNNMTLFISTALPKITVAGKSVIAVSPQSPLGQKLLGNVTGFSFEVNTTNYTIGNVF